jgi:hypothetical protein
MRGVQRWGSHLKKSFLLLFRLAITKAIEYLFAQQHKNSTLSTSSIAGDKLKSMLSNVPNNEKKIISKMN